eukprot:TRINITY_DN66751_c0_g1_i1.p1 TRINITY_DN66751_c0_g1~~TRINITY_DN66751_c0_g1_i1.p1  ORF type:complete len:212 (-),score=25.83 TRINITY_DN66751_c0_g1_i1:12-626(-)
MRVFVARVFARFRPGSSFALAATVLPVLPLQAAPRPGWRCSSSCQALPAQDSGTLVQRDAALAGEERAEVARKRPCGSSAHALPDPATEPASEAEVEARLGRSTVLLFMKGSPDAPRCRFSRRAVELLRSHGVEFDYVDVLEEPDMRVALSARWRTFPQLYAEGVLLGGSDAIQQLAERGELLDALRSSTARERAALELLLPRD